MNEEVPQPESADEFDGPLPPSLWKALNLPEPRRGDDRFAPDVDHDFLRRLVRKELPKNLVRGAYVLIDAFDSWKKAFADVIVEEFQNKQQPQAERPGTGP